MAANCRRPDDAWKGRTGFLNEAVASDYSDLSGHEVYMSGPPPMIRTARQTLNALGLPEDRLFYDSFESARD
jgi:CDP-4-dehydro-6-deoxyglucose reductase